jgi:hypothetical protein
MSQLGGSPQCILLVDDEPHLVCVVRMYLELHGFFELALRELKHPKPSRGGSERA